METVVGDGELSTILLCSCVYSKENGGEHQLKLHVDGQGDTVSQIDSKT